MKKTIMAFSLVACSLHGMGGWMPDDTIHQNEEVTRQERHETLKQQLVCKREPQCYDLLEDCCAVAVTAFGVALFALCESGLLFPALDELSEFLN